MESSIVHQLADRAEVKLSPTEIAFVKAILEGDQFIDAMTKFGLTSSAATSALSRASDYFRSYAAGRAGTEPTSAILKTGSAESDLETVFLAVGRLPRRALAGLTARYVQRLLPFVAVFADTLPRGGEQLRAVEAVLQGVESFAAGETVPSGLADLSQVVEQLYRELYRATPGLREGEAGERAYICLCNVRAVLSLVLGSGEEDHLELRNGFRACDEELYSLTDLLKAVAADAERLLSSDIDLSEGLSKLAATPGVHPLGLLWPEGEPDWYRQEVARMSKTTEKHLSSIPQLEVQISPIAFLRSMVVLFWSGFWHPFQTTEVDLSTGRVVCHY